MLSGASDDDGDGSSNSDGGSDDGEHADAERRPNAGRLKGMPNKPNTDFFFSRIPYIYEKRCNSYLRRPCTRIPMGLGDSFLKLHSQLIINWLKISSLFIT